MEPGAIPHFPQPLYAASCSFPSSVQAVYSASAISVGCAPIACCRIRAVISVNDREVADAGFISRSHQRFPRSVWRRGAADGVEACPHCHDILLAIIPRPFGNEHGGCVAEGPDDAVFILAAHEDPQCGKLMRCVPIHDIWSLHHKHISNSARSVPTGPAA